LCFSYQSCKKNDFSTNSDDTPTTYFDVNNEDADELASNSLSDDAENMLAEKNENDGELLTRASLMRVLQAFNSNLDLLPAYHYSSVRKVKYAGRHLVNTDKKTSFTLTGYGFGAKDKLTSKVVGLIAGVEQKGVEIVLWRDDSIVVNVPTLTYAPALTKSFSYKFKVYRANPKTGGKELVRVKSRTCISRKQASLVLSEVPKTATKGIVLNMKALLQGCYNAGTGLMTDNLRQQNLIPLVQPYNIPGIEYNGTETITANELTVTVNPIIDWILIEFRSPVNPYVILSRNATVIRADGSINVSDANIAQGFYNIAIRHRNHLGVISREAFEITGTTPLYNFSTRETLGVNSQKIISTGIYAMWAGDTYADGEINAIERVSAWDNKNATGYKLDDCSMNGTVDASDRSFIWNNRNLYSETTNN
jgi:hypothetical protein